MVCGKGLHSEVATSLVSPLWMWLVSVQCVLNKQVSFLAEVADMECRVGQKLCQTESLSYLAANIYCPCHGWGNTFQLENKSYHAAKWQTQTSLTLPEERAAFAALLSKELLCLSYTKIIPVANLVLKKKTATLEKMSGFLICSQLGKLFVIVFSRSADNLITFESVKQLHFLLVSESDDWSKLLGGGIWPIASGFLEMFCVVFRMGADTSYKFLFYIILIIQVSSFIWLVLLVCSCFLWASVTIRPIKMISGTEWGG